MATPEVKPTSKRMPPYLPFKTFLNSLDTLSQGVPPKLDRTFWRNQSGINQGLIMNAYRYFYLVDQNDASTDHLAALVQHPEKRPAKLKQMIQDQYMFVLQKTDITKATMKILEEAFGEVYPVTGQTKQKAITFFLKAAKFADMPLSPYLLTQLREAAKKPRRAKQRNAQNGADQSIQPQGNQAFGGSTHKVQLASGGELTITISANPFTMPPDDRSFFFSVVDMLQKYAEEHPEIQEDEPDAEEEE
jgi:hypothetical protein